MFPFDPPENVKKPPFLTFSGGSKGNIGKERVKHLWLTNDIDGLEDYFSFRSSHYSYSKRDESF